MLSSVSRIRSLIAVLFVVSVSSPLFAQKMGTQRMRAKEDLFLKTAPVLGDKFPHLQIYSSDGQPFDTASIDGHFAVFTFGCLTCPPSIWNIPELEAVSHDYAPKGVKFYYVFKSLAHPELMGGYVQPITLDERLKQARQAAHQFGTQIPWLVDAMDNRLKRALGDRPNSQFVVSPEGIVVRKRAWNNPLALRQDLAELVGASETITKAADLKLPLHDVIQPVAATGTMPRISRAGMQSIKMEVEQSSLSDSPLIAKLRAEADDRLLQTGSGKLYLGVHLDPFYEAHWNQLVDSVTVTMDASESVVLEKRQLKSEQPSSETDSDPREFLLDVKAWPANQPLSVTVTYFACIGQECLSRSERYTLSRVRDEDGGGARSPGAGLWTVEEFSRRLLNDDRDRDGKLSPDEASGILLPHFDKLDQNGDGKLEQAELDVMTQWLNEHHIPGTPEITPIMSPRR